jgi:Tol biopolymer transport system component
VDAPARIYQTARISPDGRYVAVAIFDPEQFDADIWRLDLVRGTLTRLTFAPNPDTFPLWTPDGSRVVFSSFRGGIPSLFWKPADGTGAAERLTTAKTGQHTPHAWTPDGKSLVFTESDSISDRDLFIFSPASGEEPRKLLDTQFAEENARISPDGRWIAYVSNSSGDRQVFVQGFPDMEGMWQISNEGGTNPRWSPDGSELFYRNEDKFMVVPIESEPTFSPGNPQVLFEGNYTEYDLAPDGERFIMVKPAEDSEEALPQFGATEIIIVQNWTEKFKSLVPNPK